MEGDEPETERQPGDTCTQSGVYLVTHLAHRAQHSLSVKKDDKFPRCNGCGEAVRFHLLKQSGSDEKIRDKQRKRGAGQSS
ncbi:MAG TPA: hypothetical protein VGK36_20345 [Candidatus Angelobacter sp.]|jgi:hypothetical protein